ncbi:MAG: alpha/beta hydrolase, partial [Desulfobacula sp.]|nr:alpha/beta hydrolase [Desulfobacula sp.]
PFPAAFDDSYAALQWTTENSSRFQGDTSRIFVAGDSAGGSLAAAVSLASRDQNGPAIKGQILIYPATDLSSFETDSHIQFGKGYHLTRRYMEKFRGFYLPNPEDWKHVHASPALAGDFSNLPAAFILTSQFDVLRDEGEIYAKLLQDAGVPVKTVRVEGMLHGFFTMGRIFSQLDQSILDIASFIETQD